MDERKKGRRPRRELMVVGNVHPSSEIAPWERDALALLLAKPRASATPPVDAETRDGG